MSRTGIDLPAVMFIIGAVIFLIGIGGILVTGIEIPFISDLDIIIEAIKSVHNWSSILIILGFCIGALAVILWIWDRGK